MGTSATLNKCIEKKQPHTALRLKRNTVEGNTTVRNLLGKNQQKKKGKLFFSV